MCGISFLFLANAYAEPLEKTHDQIFLFRFSVMQVVGSNIILAVIYYTWSCFLVATHPSSFIKILASSVL
jgi:hypothetical protein